MTESFDASLETPLAAETETIVDAVYTEDFSRGLDAIFRDGEPDFAGH